MTHAVTRNTVLISLIVLLGALLSPGSAEQPAGNVVAIVGATVIDGTGTAGKALTVVIRGDRIEAVAPKVELPAGARVVHADGQTLLPGLFDLHTHLPYSGASVAADWPKILKA